MMKEETTLSQETYVVAYEGDDRSVLDFAIKRAKSNDARVHIVHILEWSPYSFLTQEELAERHTRRKQELARAEESILAPALSHAREAGVAARIFGSVPIALAQLSTVPVVIVP